MRRVIRKGFQNYEVLEWHACRPEDTCQEFRDRFSALNFLCSFMRDSLSMMNLRSIFYGGSYNGGSTRLNDHQMLEQLASRLLTGQIKITMLPAEFAEWRYAAPAPEIEPREEPPLTPPPEEPLTLKVAAEIEPPLTLEIGAEIEEPLTLEIEAEIREASG